MTESKKHIIDHFQSITNWENKDDIIKHLDQYDWNLNNAMHDLMMDCNFHTGSSLDQLTTLCLCADAQLRRNSMSKVLTQENEIHGKCKKFRSDLENDKLIIGEDHHNINKHLSFTHDDQLQLYEMIDFDTSTFHEYFLQLLFMNINLISASNSNTIDNDKLKLLQYIDNNIIGKNYLFKGPWGPRKMIYADYTASGRSLWFIENYIQQYVMPSYGNTHSENNVCSSQTTKFREEARALIKKSVNATDDDVLIFTGSGSTGAIHKLVNILHLNDEENRNKTVIFISAFEHHSNILPWKETGIEIVRIPCNKQGLLDQNILKEKLEYNHNQVKKHIICTFNAASNVTGIRTDVDTVSSLVHQYHGWIFWDYASAAPYVKIDMNASETSYKDAIFISTHKFIGGPGTPGILIGKKHLFQNKVPCGCGGGTINFVTRKNVEYISDIEIREEGGTPDIIGSIRAGLVFQLKDAVGYELIEKCEDELVKKFFKRLSKIPSLILVGSQTVSRLAIFSFLIYVPMIKKYLHYNFICSLLNDLFGIQVRSGCACAGPYVLDLFGISDETAQIYSMFLAENPNGRIDEENNQLERILLMKPGFTRLNLSYFASDEEIDYILNAIEFLAYHAWKFLPLYTYEPLTGVWNNRETHSKNQYSLKTINYENSQMQQNSLEFENKTDRLQQSKEISLPNDCFYQAELIANDAGKRDFDYKNDPELNILDKYKRFIWFALPKDIVLMVSDQSKEEIGFPRSIDEHPIDWNNSFN